MRDADGRPGRGGGPEESGPPRRVVAQPVDRAEEQFVARSPLEIPVRLVLPGEADAAVQLDGLTGGDPGRLQGLGEREGPASGSRAAWYAAERAASTRTYRSARRCLTAWNEPTALPNCSRAFTYSTVRSRALAAVPTASAARIAAAVRPAAASAAAASAVSSAPRSSAGVSRSSTRASGRVSSTEVSRVRASPAAPESTRNRSVRLRG